MFGPLRVLFVLAMAASALANSENQYLRDYVDSLDLDQTAKDALYLKLIQTATTVQPQTQGKLVITF